ncbi:VOC family protein [Hymenobacter guriensis]|uniref:VOC family protein n=1 Tax=Hymenobacter guriensis TaxID=2793065 RepID=A0ABS0L9W2_9BACT|nr:VOC family protein [Hymenobacter guriensis]MBG8556397.1 VOC family protein [Hymenobacter guriensis]
MFQGLRTVLYTAENLSEAVAWYRSVLGEEPYFNEPYYAGFNVGGYELGLVPDGATGAGGQVAYWGVPDAKAAFARLLALGATSHEAVHDVGGGIRLGTVLDPFANVLGVIQNPHFQLPA